MGKMTERELDFLRRVASQERLRVADRDEDKVRQRCRKLGLVEFVRSWGKWKITLAGRAALSQGERGMTENEQIEHLVDAIIDALERSADEVGSPPHHLVIAATAVAVKLAWAGAADKAEVRPALISMIEDFATQSELGRMTEQ